MNSENKINRSIGCTVQQCKYHCGQSDNCTLYHIQIGTHEVNPTQIECTDCRSFELK